jgi:hypothetical protein
MSSQDGRLQSLNPDSGLCVWCSQKKGCPHHRTNPENCPTHVALRKVGLAPDNLTPEQAKAWNVIKEFLVEVHLINKGGTSYYDLQKAEMEATSLVSRQDIPVIDITADVRGIPVTLFIDVAKRICVLGLSLPSDEQLAEHFRHRMEVEAHDSGLQLPA